MTLTNNETTLKGTVEQMKKENESLSNSVSLKIKECEALDLKIANLDSQLLALQNEGTSKSKTIEALKEEINSVKESYQVGKIFVLRFSKICLTFKTILRI